MRSIRVSDVLGWQNILIGILDKNGKKFSPCYLKTIHDQCSAIFNHAVRYYDLKSNPASKAGNMGKEKTKEMLFWTKEEYTNFSEAIREKPDYYFAFEILYWYGLRMGEMLALTPSDFQFEKGTVRITKTYQRIGSEDIITDPKTPKSNRVVQMPAFLIKEVQTYIQSLEGIHPDDRIFKMSGNGLRKVMKPGSLKAGVKPIRIHDLRHPYVKYKTKKLSFFSKKSPVIEILRSNGNEE